MNNHKRTYLDMQEEEASWASGRYALANGATTPEKGNSILEAFERIMLSAGNEIGRLPIGAAQFALSENSQDQ